MEVHFRGVWSTVCDSEWYDSEAQVVCRSLGCGTVASTPKGLPHSLPGKMYYSCKGEEPTLSDCSWRFNNSNLCSQSSAARVLCSGIPPPHPLLPTTPRCRLAIPPELEALELVGQGPQCGLGRELSPLPCPGRRG